MVLCVVAFKVLYQSFKNLMCRKFDELALNFVCFLEIMLYFFLSEIKLYNTCESSL